MKEEWKYIRGYNKKFAVSDRGKVWVNRFDRSKVLSAGNIHDYRNVVLWFNGKRKTCLVHRLVAKAFIPNPLNLPEVNHKNGKKWDNRKVNLEWVTKSQNAIHKYKVLGNKSKGGIDRVSVKQFSKEGKLIAKFKSITDASRYTGIDIAQISGCVLNKLHYKTAGGFIWKKSKK